MKKIISFLSLVVVVAVMACNDKPVQKEVIVVPAPAPVIIVKDPPEKSGTTITLDKNGVKVEAKKVGVTIKNK
jgi:hypothetical protein